MAWQIQGKPTPVKFLRLERPPPEEFFRLPMDAQFLSFDYPEVIKSGGDHTEESGMDAVLHSFDYPEVIVEVNHTIAGTALNAAFGSFDYSS